MTNPTIDQEMIEMNEAVNQTLMKKEPLPWESKGENPHTEQRFTLSFINNSPGLVIRGDSAVEVEESLREIQPVFKAFREAIDTKRAQSQATTQPQRKTVPVAHGQGGDPMWCDYHNVKMFKTANMKKPAHVDDERGWCNGQGYEDERTQWRNNAGR